MLFCIFAPSCRDVIRYNFITWQRKNEYGVDCHENRKMSRKGKEIRFMVRFIFGMVNTFDIELLFAWRLNLGVFSSRMKISFWEYQGNMNFFDVFSLKRVENIKNSQDK